MIPDPKHARTQDEHSPTPDERAAHSRAILKVKCGCEDCRSFAEAHDALVEALRQANDDATWLMVMLGDMSNAAPDNVDRWHRIAARLEAAARAALDAAKGGKHA